MNSKERLDRFVRNEPVDRRANVTIVGSVVTQYEKMSIEEYCKNYRKMVDGAIACAKDVGLDYVQIASDLLREAEGFGSKLVFYPDDLPALTEPALQDIEEAEKLQPLTIKDVPRLYDIVLATKYAVETEPDIYPMTAIVGPATIAGNVRGVEDWMMDSLTEPELCKKLLEVCTETIINMIDELAAVGSKYIYMPDPIASLFSPATYQELLQDEHTRIFEHMKSKGITGRLHMCGNTEHILPYNSQTGVRIIDIDHQVNYKKALELVEGRVILNGNIDPVADVFESTPEKVYDSIIKLHESVGDAHCMFMPGCELPEKTNAENIKAITRALEVIG